MRNPKRIPIVLTILCNNYRRFEEFLGVEPNSGLALNIIRKKSEIETFWKKSPDLRFGQLLCVMRLIPNLDIENQIWNIEESDWLVQKGYCNYEDIHFWGVNFFKSGKPRKKIKYVLLKDLTTNHITNILLWFYNQNRLTVINSKYLTYFKKRLNE